MKEDEAIELISQKPLKLSEIKDQTHKICMTAVKANGNALQYVKIQTQKICFAAIESNPKAIRFLKANKPAQLFTGQNWFLSNKLKHIWLGDAESKLNFLGAKVVDEIDESTSVVVLGSGSKNLEKKSKALGLNTINELEFLNVLISGLVNGIDEEGRILALKEFFNFIGQNEILADESELSENLLFRMSGIVIDKNKTTSISPEKLTLYRQSADAINKIKLTQSKSYLPNLSSKEQGKITDSKFGGIPYLCNNEEWPLCGHCQKPMSFGFQLNLTQHPKLRNEFNREGLFQFFACSIGCKSEPSNSKGTSEDKSVSIRFLEMKELNKELHESPVKNERSQIITGWRERFDYAGSSITDEIFGKNHEYFEEDIEGLNAKLDFEIFCPSYSSFPSSNEKVLGWYHGSYQGDQNHPFCKCCNKIMVQVITIDGYPKTLDCWQDQVFSIFMCLEHPGMFEYSWYDSDW